MALPSQRMECGAPSKGASEVGSGYRSGPVLLFSPAPEVRSLVGWLRPVVYRVVYRRLHRGQTPL